MTLPLKLSETSGVPYYRQIVDQISELIRAGQLEPEELLPSVRDLSKELLVSLITTRRAYRELQALGLIQVIQGKGTFVARDVEATSREQARGLARQILDEAITRARQLGLRGDDLEEAVAELLDELRRG